LERLTGALGAGSDNTAALETMRALIDRIMLTPSEAAGFEIEVEDDAASMLALGQAAAACGTRTPNSGRCSYERSAVLTRFIVR
jgi:hypothetical protein